MNSPSLRSQQLNTRWSLFPSPKQKLLSRGFLNFKRDLKNRMVLKSESPSIRDEILRINGRESLTGVPGNVVISPAGDSSAFLGAIFPEKSSRHVFKIGVLQDHRLLCLFRFKIWWMIPRMGNSGRDVPAETQMLLLESKEGSAIDEHNRDACNGSTFYIVFLPVLDGNFRSSLQGNPSNELEFCIESGDPAVETSQCLEAVFVNYGDNPFDLMKESIKTLEKHKGTFAHREGKKMPGNLDWFGWCTWDAFYTDVNPQGINEGLKSLSEGGTPARFLIIDDGWQVTDNEFHKEGKPFIELSYFATRLISFKENTKFHGTGNATPDKVADHLKDFITNIKETFGLKYVYVWHAMMGYWGGVDPNAPEMKMYNPKLLYPVQSPGNLANLRDVAIDGMEKFGVGTPTKIFEFYNDLHGYLVSQNVDGVKVDIQNVMETLGTGFGGRVGFTRQFQQALERSIAKNFRENNLICSMGHNTDSVYSLKECAVTRVSEDYMLRNLPSQTLHIASVAFNSIFLGEIVVPDWDMFCSQHHTAEFHAVARALGGCPVYVSDKPNEHDFKILKKIVLPDGSVLRAKYPGRPTRDCLFNDPVMGGKSLLKIWNLNKFSGVLGVFNCQGTGTWPCLDGIKNISSSELSGSVSPIDIEYLEEIVGKNWTGDCAVFAFNAGSLSRLPKTGSLSVSLKVLQCEIFTVSPIMDYDENIQLAPLGLVDMYNSGGAIEAMDVTGNGSDYQLRIKGRGSGCFGAYSSLKPKICIVNANEEEYKYQSKDGFLTVTIPHRNHSDTGFWDIAIIF